MIFLRKTMKNIEESAIIYKNYALNIVIFASLRYPFHEEVENMEKVLVFGHKNPDTDAICSAIAYAELKKN